MADVREWIVTLIGGATAVGFSIIIAQEFCKIEPSTCSIFPAIIGAAVAGLVLALKFGLTRR